MSGNLDGKDAAIFKQTSKNGNQDTAFQANYLAVAEEDGAVYWTGSRYIQNNPPAKPDTPYTVADMNRVFGGVVWQDRSRMQGGVDWWRQITDAIDDCRFLVLIVSPEAMRSSIVQKEWQYGRQQGVCICPVMTQARLISEFFHDGWPKSTSTM